MHLFKTVHIVALVNSVACITATASAHPNRINLWLHGQHNLSERASVKSEFAYAGIQSAHPTTYVYGGAGYKTTKWLTVDLFAGFRGDGIGILSPRTFAQFDQFSAFTLVEIYSNADSYWFQTADYAVADWLKTGAEYESFGSYSKLKEISHGFGPHFILLLDRYALDSILQARRDNNKHWGPELQFRIHGNF